MNKLISDLSRCFYNTHVAVQSHKCTRAQSKPVSDYIVDIMTVFSQSTAAERTCHKLTIMKCWSPHVFLSFYPVDKVDLMGEMFFKDWACGRQKQTQEEERADWGAETRDQGSLWFVWHRQRPGYWLPRAEGERWGVTKLNCFYWTSPVPEFLVWSSQQVAMRALGFEVKKVDVLKILKDYDREGTGKITFEDFSEVGKLTKISSLPRARWRWWYTTGKVPDVISKK